MDNCFICKEKTDKLGFIKHDLNKHIEGSFMDKKLRVWWIPQVPMKAFYINVKDVVEARKILQVLADYDTFQFENRIKPDYSNAGGLQMLDGKEWVEWYCSRCDSDIDECECDNRD